MMRSICALIVLALCGCTTAPVQPAQERVWILMELRPTPSGGLGIGKLMTEEELRLQLQGAAAADNAPANGGKQY